MNPVQALAPYRILSLDGGGMKGFYTARLLARLLKHYETTRGVGPLDLGKGFDLIAGTSTGAILGLAIAAGNSPDVIDDFYRQHGPEIFPKPVPDFAWNLQTLGWIWKHLDRPASSKAALATHLDRVLGAETLMQLWERRRIAVVVPAVSVANYGPKVFKTPHLADYTHDREIRLRDVCLASSAAPILFPPHDVKMSQGYFRDDNFVDGGIWANNPALVGLIEAITILAARDEKRPIHVYSFGTCSARPSSEPMQRHPNGGLKTWSAGKTIAELAQATSGKAMNFMTNLLARALSTRDQEVHYLRIPEPVLTPQQEKTVGLDRSDPAAFLAMEDLAATTERQILSDLRAGTNPVYRNLREIFESLPAPAP